MSYKHQYNLGFGKHWYQDKGITYRAVTQDGSPSDLATFLTLSNLEETLAQIAGLPDTGDVKVGDTILPNKDFKGLLLEWVEYIEPRTFENESAKLIKYSGLPITRVEFDQRYQLGESYMDENMEFTKIQAKLYVNEVHVGDYPYMSGTFGFMFSSHYDINTWTKIAEIFHDQLFAEIVKQESRAASVTIRSYETLFVKNVGGENIKIAHCKFMDGQWQVRLSGPNIVEVRKTVTVKLTPPKIDF